MVLLDLANEADKGNISQVLIIISSGIIILLLSVVSFLYKKYMDKIEAESKEREERQLAESKEREDRQSLINNKLENTLDRLSESINGFNGIAVRWEERTFSLEKNQIKLEKRYEDHLDKLHEK